jgi:GT2 family glycosyltransferase
MHGVSIVIPTWKGLPLLQRFLPSVLVAANRYGSDQSAPVEIIIVDDNGDDGSDGTVGWLMSIGFVEDLSAVNGDSPAPLPGVASRQAPGEVPPVEQVKAGPRLRFIRNARNLGFAKSCNRGIRLTRLPLVLLLNNDVEIQPDCIAPLARHFEEPFVFAAHCHVFDLETRRVCGTGKLGSFARGFIRVHKSYVLAQKPDSGARGGTPSAFAGGGACMLDRDKFIAIGGFDELMSPFYWEDVELSYRAWKRGYSIVYEPLAVARHRVSSTIRSLNRHKVQRISDRNRLIYHWIHLHDRGYLLSHVVWVALLAVTSPLRLRPRFVLSVLDALRMLPEIRVRREKERGSARRTDREIFALFLSLSGRPDLLVYDRSEDLPRTVETRDRVASEGGRQVD